MADLEKQIADLQRVNEEQASKLSRRGTAANKLTLKVSEGKGCLCVYGLQRRPVSLYVNQWERFFSLLGTEMPEAFRTFIAENEAPEGTPTVHPATHEVNGKTVPHPNAGEYISGCGFLSRKSD
jgi:hypothetical protein